MATDHPPTHPPTNQPTNQCCRGVRPDRFGNLQPGDVIVAVAGQPVSSVEDLVAYVEQFAVGDQVCGASVSGGLADPPLTSTNTRLQLAGA